MSLFLSPITILQFDEYAAEEYGRNKAEHEKKGTPIGSMDTLIAGHAKSRGLILVTNNTREFKRVAGLTVEDWAQNFRLPATFKSLPRVSKASCHTL